MDWPFLLSIAGHPYNDYAPAEPLDQTNGMVERLSGRISEVLATHHFNSGPPWRGRSSGMCISTITTRRKKRSATNHRLRP